MAFIDSITKQLFDYKIWAYLIESLKENEIIRGNRKFWTDGNEILCKSEEDANIVADFLNDLGFEDIRTGYYDPEEDKRNNECDENTGYYYIADL